MNRRARVFAVLAGVLLAGGVAGAVLVVPVLTSGASAPVSVETADAGPRALTTDEAERLAVTRFLGYQDGSRTFRVRIGDGATAVTLHGRIDHRAGRGLALASAEGENALITWDATTLVAWSGVSASGSIPSEIPGEPGDARALAPTASTVDAVLALLLGLGSDRPDNAELLRQSDAVWLRSEQLDGESVDVIAGPSPSDGSGGTSAVRFWIDAEGALHRVDADLPSGGISIELNAESHVAVPEAGQLATGH